MYKGARTLHTLPKGPYKLINEKKVHHYTIDFVFEWINGTNILATYRLRQMGSH